MKIIRITLSFVKSGISESTIEITLIPTQYSTLDRI